MRYRGEHKIPSRFAMAMWFFLFLLFIVVISGGIAVGLGYSPRPLRGGFMVPELAITETVEPRLKMIDGTVLKGQRSGRDGLMAGALEVLSQIAAR